MHIRLIPLVFVVSCLLVSSCASSYRNIYPSRLQYPEGRDEAVFSYRYNVLKEARNRKLAKKEDKRNLQVVAIKIVNTTGQTLVYETNFMIYSMEKEVRVLDPRTATAAIKQTVPTYLFYMLFTPMKLFVNNGTETRVTPIGYVLGPALAGGNMLVAASANKKFRTELENGSLFDRPIAPGETFYGLITIPDNQFMPLTLWVADR